MGKKIDRIYPIEILWVRRNYKILKISSIEKALRMPGKTLSNFVQGYVGLKETWWDGLISWVREFTSFSRIPGPGSVGPNRRYIPKKWLEAETEAVEAPADHQEAEKMQTTQGIEAKIAKPAASSAFLERRRAQKNK